MKNRKGFTLTELAVVIVIIGIVAAFTLPNMQGISEQKYTVKAIETVKTAIVEYQANNASDYEKNLIVLYYDDTENSVKIFGYDSKYLYVFSGTQWLFKAATNAASQGFEKVSRDIVNSADIRTLAFENSVYPEANKLFTTSNGDSSDLQTWRLNKFLTDKQQRKYNGNLYIISATIDKSFTYDEKGVLFDVAYAEPELVSSASVVPEYITKFVDFDGTVLHTYKTTDTSLDGKFTCPADADAPSGKFFRCWKLIKVNDEDKDIDATGLVPGDSYDIPNSNVTYQAIYRETDTPALRDSIYAIYNSAELEWFTSSINSGSINVNSSARLMRSFYINQNVIDGDGKLIVRSDYKQSTPIGNSTDKAYKGTFDGNGHSISGIYMNPEAPASHKALFGYVKGATIKNLTVRSSYIKGINYVSALVADTNTFAQNETPNSTTISNCSVINTRLICTDAEAVDMPYKEIITTTGAAGSETTTITPEGGTYAGGIVGYAMYTSINSCSVDGTIWGGNNGSAIGGIAGVINNINGNTTIRKSYSLANVAGARYVGGIAGKVIALPNHDSDLLATANISDCYNNGKVSRVSELAAFTFENETDPYYITEEDYCIGYGGIVGGATAKVKLLNCYNESKGRITAGNNDKSATGIGGILGISSYTNTNTFNNCRNFGSVSGRVAAGGIVGEVRVSAVELNSCINAGKVEAIVISGGGMIGRTRNVATGTILLEKCISTEAANVSANKRVGGMIGDNCAIVKVNSCTNNGSVTELSDTVTSKPGAGGIIGVTFNKANVYYCVNNGKVTSYGQGAGGIIGRSTSATFDSVFYTSDGTLIDKCYNSGYVEMSEITPDHSATPTATPDSDNQHYYAGGLLGYSNAIITVDYSFNAGYVLGVSYNGGIAGAIATPEPTATPIPTTTPAPTESPAPSDSPAPTVSPVPTQTPEEETNPTESSINNCYCVGLIESKGTDNNYAGAILGTDEYLTVVTNSYYLNNIVIADNVVTTSTLSATPFATEKTKSQFLKEITDAQSVTRLLNNSVQPENQIYYLPTVEAGSTESIKFIYNSVMEDRILEFNKKAKGNKKITLPEKLPLLIDRTTFESFISE